jgi:hypothetical protein
MKDNKQVAIVLNRIFQRHLPSPRGSHLPGSAVKKIASNSQPASDGNVHYTYRYLFGESSRFPGILSLYLEGGWSIDIFEEGYFNTCVSRRTLSKYGLIDVQFASEPNHELLETCHRGVIGWAPFLGSKQMQALRLSLNPETCSLLPRTLLIPDKKSLQAAKQSEVNSHFPPGYLITKPFFSTHSKMPDNSEYRIFHRNAWNDLRNLALSRADSWLRRDSGLMVSELIQTRDPYLGNRNHVVHKVHLPSGEIPGNWSLECRKMAARLSLERIGDGIASLDQLFHLDFWNFGRLENYRETLSLLMRDLTPAPCLFGVDLMITPDGALHWLEFNKIAGTYLDPTGKNGKAPLEDFYRGYVLRGKAPSPSSGVSWFDDIEPRLDRVAWV